MIQAYSVIMKPSESYSIDAAVGIFLCADARANAIPSLVPVSNVPPSPSIRASIVRALIPSLVRAGDHSPL